MIESQVPHPLERPTRHQEPVGKNQMEDAIDHDPGDELYSGDETKELLISSDQADALQLYIWHIRDLLGLSNWDVFLAMHCSQENSNATISPVVGRRLAPLRISGPEWFDKRPTDQRNDILHELIHLAHNDLTEVWRLGLGGSGALSTKLWDGLYTLFCREAELMTDQLATALAPLFPLMEDVPEVAAKLRGHNG